MISGFIQSFVRSDNRVRAGKFRLSCRELVRSSYHVKSRFLLSWYILVIVSVLPWGPATKYEVNYNERNIIIKAFGPEKNKMK